MKRRAMIYLDADDLEALREEARVQRLSLAELVRRAVKQYLARHHAGPPPNPEVYLKIIALGASGRAEISERHDHYLGDPH